MAGGHRFIDDLEYDTITDDKELRQTAGNKKMINGESVILLNMTYIF